MTLRRRGWRALVVAGAAVSALWVWTTRAQDAAPDASAAPGSRAGARTMAALERIEATLRTTRYRHATRVDARRGLYQFDCSGLVNHVLQRTAPGAFRGLGRPRPVARTYARTIAGAPVTGQRRGWRRLARLEDVRPGDVWAVEREAWWPGRDTGHVGFFVSRPVAIDAERRRFVATIVDSTPLPHEGDTRRLGGEGGYGRGTMAFEADASGRVIAAGWWGDRGPYFPVEVQLGRVVR